MEKDEDAWHFILNPAAARGAALRRWQRLYPRLRAALPGMTVSQSTTTTGLTTLAEQAVRAGRYRIVGVGGDGTHHQIINGLVASERLATVTYAPLPLGSGNDWVRTLATPRRLKPWLRTLARGATITYPLGQITYRTEEGQTASRYFINVAGLAYDAVVVRRSETAPFKHRYLYPLLTLAYLPGFRPPSVRLTYAGNTFTGPVHTINLGIGRYNGGGMRLVPHADHTRDTFALTFARQLPLTTILAQSWRFYTGGVSAITGVTLARTPSVTVEALKGKVEIEADGEWLGTAPIEARLTSQRLRVIIGEVPLL